MDQNYVQRSRPPVEKPRQASKRDYYDDEPDDDIYSTRMPSSTRRYQSDVQWETGHAPADVQKLPSGRHSSIPPRRTAASMDAGQARRRRSADTEDIPLRQSGSLRAQQRVRPHWLVFAGIGLLVMMVGWLLLSGLLSWWQVTQDDWHYGRPRTYQTDYVVGHSDSAANPSHFIAINLHRQVEVIEIAGNDASKTRIYTGPQLIGADQDLAVVTLTFKDVNGDGKPDMIVNVQDSHFVFINDVVNAIPQFRPVHPGETIQL